MGAMGKLWFALVFVTLTGCTRHTAELKNVLPVEVQRTWTLKEARHLPDAQAPSAAKSLGLKRALEARYEGNGSIQLQLLEMNTETSAFEMYQKWNQADGLAVYTGPYFLIATPSGPDRATTGSFLLALQQSIQSGHGAGK